MSRQKLKTSEGPRVARHTRKGRGCQREAGDESSEPGIKRSKIWSQEELLLLAAFFYYNGDKFQSQEQKKRWKIFKTMSNFISSKNVNQCRTYTIKLLRLMKSVDKINQFLRDSLSGYETAVGGLRDRNIEVFRELNSCSIFHDTIDHMEFRDNTGSGTGPEKAEELEGGLVQRIFEEEAMERSRQMMMVNSWQAYKEYCWLWWLHWHCHVPS